MKIKTLIEELKNFDPNSEVVIQTQKGHSLFGDISTIEESEESPEILVMQFKNEGYSPKQALRIEC